MPQVVGRVQGGLQYRVVGVDAYQHQEDHHFRKGYVT